MRVVILTSPGHIYANYLVKQLLQREGLFELVGVVQSTVLLPGKSYLQGLVRYLDKAGPRFFVAQATKASYYRVGLALNRRLGRADPESPFTAWQDLVVADIPTLSTARVNTRAAREFLADRRPDLFVLVLFGQILKQKTLQIPTVGTLNFHPSLLPRHRGLMPVFWALASGDETTGVSVHLVDEGIDTGAILSQERIGIRAHDTEHGLYARSCVVGARLLASAIAQLGRDEAQPIIVPEGAASSYHSIPDRESVREFRRHGRRFFRWRELRRPFESF